MCSGRCPQKMCLNEDKIATMNGFCYILLATVRHRGKSGSQIVTQRDSLSFYLYIVVMNSNIDSVGEGSRDDEKEARTG